MQLLNIVWSITISFTKSDSQNIENLSSFSIGASAVVAGKLLVFSIPSEHRLLSRKDIAVDTFDPAKDAWIRSKSHQIPIKGDRLLVTSDGERYENNCYCLVVISALDTPTSLLAVTVRSTTLIAVTL